VSDTGPLDLLFTLGKDGVTSPIYIWALPRGTQCFWQNFNLNRYHVFTLPSLMYVTRANSTRFTSYIVSQTTLFLAR